MVYFKDYEMTTAERETGAKLFSESWVTDYSSIGLPNTGKAKLVNDWRLRWLSEQIGGLTDLRILELGSFEGAHTITFSRMGARFCTGIEANAQHFLKSCFIKNYTNLNNIEFLLGDFIGFMEQNEKQYDIVSACGVLYHLKDPARLIRAAYKSTKYLFLWTVIYDEERLPQSVRPYIRGKLSLDLDGFFYTGYEHVYRSAPAQELHSKGLFSGGSESCSLWLERHELNRILEHYGFRVISEQINAEPNPLHGSNVLIVAEAKG